MNARWLGLVLLAAAGLTLMIWSSRSSVRESAPTPEAEADEKTEQRFERVAASMWWHRDRFADDLALSDRQVTQMDRLCIESLRRRKRLREQVRPQAKAFRDALVRGEMEAAESATEGLANLAADLQVIEHRMILGVLDLLSEDQLATLRQRAPVLLERPWLKTVGGRGTSPPDGPPRAVPRAKPSEVPPGGLKAGDDASESERSQPAS